MTLREELVDRIVACLPLSAGPFDRTWDSVVVVQANAESRRDIIASGLSDVFAVLSFADMWNEANESQHATLTVEDAAHRAALSMVHVNCIRESLRRDIVRLPSSVRSIPAQQPSLGEIANALTELRTRIAELEDHDSIRQWYEDFAQLALWLQFHGLTAENLAPGK
jgi:hypothetical protein